MVRGVRELNLNVRQILRNLRPVKQAVQAKEKELALGTPFYDARPTERIRGRWRKILSDKGTQYNYCATPPGELLRHFLLLGRECPEALAPLVIRGLDTFIDLGSGLGMACFTASFMFSNVIGFEEDPLLHTCAQQIQREIKIPRVQFINLDFTREFDAARGHIFDDKPKILYLFAPLGRRAEIMSSHIPLWTLLICRSLAKPVLDTSLMGFQLVFQQPPSDLPGHSKRFGFYSYINYPTI